MRYFKAFEQTEKPLITWSLWAESFAELEKMGEDDNPLILSEDDVPAYQYGVCPLKIDGGVLVNRSTAEMDAFEIEYNDSIFLLSQLQKLDGINGGAFSYDTEEFPMDERSRLFYHAIDKKTPAGDVKMMTINGTLYNLANANIAAFLGAYYTELTTLAQPDV